MGWEGILISRISNGILGFLRHIIRENTFKNQSLRAISNNEVNTMDDSFDVVINGDI